MEMSDLRGGRLDVSLGEWSSSPDFHSCMTWDKSVNVTEPTYCTYFMNFEHIKSYNERKHSVNP